MSVAMVTPGHENVRISTQTVCNRLMDYGIRDRHPYHVIHLMPPCQCYIAHWVHQHLHWTQNQWNTVLFSDESWFCLDHPDEHMRCYHINGEHYSDACVLKRDHFGGPSVIVWGAISFHRHSELTCVQDNLAGERYCDKILVPVVIPFFNASRNITLFQQDNARCHTACVSIRYLDEQHVRVLLWLAFSPELSSIKHLWNVLDHHIRHCDHQNTDQL